MRHHLHSKNNVHRQDNDNDVDDEVDDDGITAWIASIATTVSSPMPFVDPPLAWGYPLVLLASLGILPPTTSLPWIALFILFSWLGRTVIPFDDWDENNNDNEEATDDNQRPSTDLLALGASIVTSGIVAPFGSNSNNSLVLSWNQSPWIMASLGGFLVIGLGLVLSRISMGKVLVRQASDTSSSEEQLQVEDRMLSNEREWMELWDRSLEEQESNKGGKSDKGL